MNTEIDKVSSLNDVLQSATWEFGQAATQAVTFVSEIIDEYNIDPCGTGLTEHLTEVSPRGYLYEYSENNASALLHCVTDYCSVADLVHSPEVAKQQVRRILTSEATRVAKQLITLIDLENIAQEVHS